METYFWIFWTVLGAVLIIAEIFTTGFVLLWFGIGALAAAFAAFIGVNSITAQFLIFAIISIALTAASRTIFVNYFSREKAGGDLKSGVEALPGQIGTVVSSSRGALQEGADFLSCGYRRRAGRQSADGVETDVRNVVCRD